MRLTVKDSDLDPIGTWLDAPDAAVSADPGVPGTSAAERHRLAMLGGVARALAGEGQAHWPASLRSWALAAPALPDPLAQDLRHGLGARTDPLAALYERAVSGRARRALGTFFTPPDVVEHMLETASRLVGQPATVIDPGAGVGAFSLAAARRWPQARVVAVDVNVVTLGLLAARADDLLGRIELAHEDFLEWAGTRAGEMPEPRLWIGNPPYTRHQDMSEGTKESVRRSAARLVRSGLAGLSAYFLAVTLDALAPEDGLCYLLPGSWTDARYGRPLRDELAGMRGREVGLIGFPSERQLFPGTRVTAMILVVGPSRTAPQAMWSTAVEIRDNRIVEGSHVPRDRPDAPAEGCRAVAVAARGNS